MGDISQLFAIEAEQLLLADLLDEAIELCRKGLAEYPDYPAAYTVLVSALLSNGHSEEAYKEINKSLQLFPNNKSLIELREQIELKLSKDDLIETQNKIHYISGEEGANLSFLNSVLNLHDFGNRNIELRANNLSLIPGLDFTPLKMRSSLIIQRYGIHVLPDELPYSFSGKSKPEIDDTHQDKDKLSVKPLPGTDQIAMELLEDLRENENMEYSEKKSEYHTSKSHKKPSSTKHFITETIANIYIQQKAYSQAIEAFKKLSKQFPEKKLIYENKIKEIKHLK